MTRDELWAHMERRAREHQRWEGRDPAWRHGDVILRWTAEGWNTAHVSQQCGSGYVFVTGQNVTETHANLQRTLEESGWINSRVEADSMKKLGMLPLDCCPDLAINVLLAMCLGQSRLVQEGKK